MENKCPNCGYIYGEYDIYCARCGAKLSTANNLDIKNKFANESIYKKEDCKTCFAKYYCSGGCNANNLPAVSFYLNLGGIQGDEALPNVPKEDQIIHFEFYRGE